MGGCVYPKTYLLLAVFWLTMISTASAKIVYVDTDAAGANDGSSWADAYNYLQDALADASSASKPVEIRVAQGIYTPDSNSTNPNGSGDREATFHLINVVTIKGGYAGTGTPDPNSRDIELYETILSGDLDVNDIEVNDPCDLWDEPSRAENSYHVVTGSDTDETAFLDGFTITGGYANGPEYENQHRAGGMYTASGGPTVTNCAFIRNSARYGGGMYNSSGVLRIFDCTFEENRAGYGGGMANQTSDLTVINCTFSANYAPWPGGGGMYNEESSPTLTNCTFIKNKALRGGGIFNKNSSSTITNCTFCSNTAEYYGGAILCEDNSSSTIKNNLIEGNSANEGGGICCWGASPTIQGNVIKSNKVSLGAIGFQGLGGGISFRGDSSAIITDNVITNNSAIGTGGGIFSDLSKLMLFNNIITANEATDEPCGMGLGGGIYCGRSTVRITNNTISGNRAHYQGILVQGGGIQISGSVNLVIVNSILWSNGPDEIHYRGEPTVEVTYSNVQCGWPGGGNIDVDPCFAELGYWDSNGTTEDANDDFWVDGDYHLLPDSPCIDAGDPNYIAEPNETDLDGRPRVIGGRIDMGAYEYSPPIQANIRIVPRTISLASSGKWINAFLWLPEDYNIIDIDSSSVLLEDEIEPQWVWFDEEEQVAMVRFSRQEVRDILTIGEVELTIAGQLTDGTVFEAKDVIIVINKGSRKSAK